jgi:hypothetical protein
MIDGGRAYTRHNPNVPLHIYKIVNGNFEVDNIIDVLYNERTLEEQ